MKRTLTVAMILCAVMMADVYAQGIKLEYKFEREKSYRYKIILEAKTEQEMMGNEIKSEVNGINIIHVVGKKAKPDGSTVVAATIDSSMMRVKAGGIDTTQIPWNIIGREFRMDVAKNGRVSNFTAADTADQEAGQMVQNQMGHYPILSENTISVGSSWNAETSDTVFQKQFNGTIITDTKEKYTLAGKETKDGYDCYKIVSTGKLIITGKGNVMGMDLHIDGTGNSKADIFFDQSQGVVVATEADVNMQMTVATTGQSPMVIPTSESMKLIRTLLK